MADTFSASSLSPLAKRKRILTELVEQYELFEESHSLSQSSHKALQSIVSTLEFWHIGYNTLLKGGELALANEFFKRAMARKPYAIRMRKSYFLFRLRNLFRVVR